MVDIHHEGIADAPVPVTFAYLDDYRNTPKWMFGLAAFTPIGALDHGLGARFDGTFQVKPVKLHSTVEVTEWVQDSVISLRSIKGFPNRSTWRFSALPGERTEVRVDFSYDLPGGIAGKALGRALEPIVTLSVRRSDEALRRCVAEFHSSEES